MRLPEPHECKPPEMEHDFSSCDLYCTNCGKMKDNIIWWTGQVKVLLKQEKEITPFPEKPSQAVMDGLFITAKDTLRPLCRYDKPLARTNNYGMVDEAGNITTFPNQVCFQDLYKIRFNLKPPYAYFVDWTHRYSEYDDWIDWLVNESPWAQVCMIKNPEMVRRLGQVYRTEFSPKYIMQAACLHRHSFDQKHLLNMWKRLKEVCHPTVAFILAHCLYEDDRGMFCVISQFGGGHQVIHYTHLTPTEFRNIVNGNLCQTFETQTMREGNLKFPGTMEIWGPTYGQTVKRTSVRAPKDTEICYSELKHLEKERLTINHEDTTITKTNSLGMEITLKRYSSLGAAVELILKNNFSEDEVKQWLL